MEFRKYEKVHRLGKEETAGILNGTVHVEEKLDGANTSIWLDSDGNICTGSRTRFLGTNNFNGFGEYARNHKGIMELLTAHPDWRLYGEWLVRHTIHYKETSYKQFYLFDIHNGESFMPADYVELTANLFGIDAVPYLGVFENPTEEQLREFVGKSKHGEKGEGIVIKNPAFINEFGDRVCAKIVTEEFKEDNGIIFGGNNKHSDCYWEMFIVNKYMTLARVRKVMQKLQPIIDISLGLEHTSRVAGTAYHDMMTEEIWEIAMKVGKVDFKVLSRIAHKKAQQIYKDILADSISVADLK